MYRHRACIRIPASCAAGIGAYEQSDSSVKTIPSASIDSNFSSMVIHLYLTVKSPFSYTDRPSQWLCRAALHVERLPLAIAQSRE